MTIQSVLFKKSVYKTRGSAVKWLLKNGYKSSIKPDPNPESLNFWRYRQIQPTKFKKNSFHTTKHNNSIYFVIGTLKNNNIKFI